MKAKHIYHSHNVNDEDIVIHDHYSILVEGVRQDSLGNQLIDLVEIAENIGYFAASDYIAKHIPTNNSPKENSKCETCDNRIVQLDLIDSTKDFVDGCKLISKACWKKGLKDNIQTNCPL